MRTKASFASQALGAALAAGLAAGLTLAAPSRAGAIAPAGAPADAMSLSVGRGQLVRLNGPMSDVFVADDKVADVQVRSSTQLYVFAKKPGETNVYATNKAGQVVWSSVVRVGENITNIGQMLRLAMPEAAITATPMNGMVLLTGTVAAPQDVEEAQNLVQAFVGKEVTVVSRLKTATPLQVNLQVRIAEVDRDFTKQIGVNLLSRDTTGGFLFGIAQGRNVGPAAGGTIGNADLSGLPKLDASNLFGLPTGTLSLPFDPSTGQFITKAATTYNLSNLGQGAGITNLAFAGKLFGLDMLGALDLAENDGMVTTLANPNLTALSGETASFLAGGEIPIPISQALGTVSVEYKQYGVSLAFTPTVLADGRISMRVRPEVSQLSTAGQVTLNGFSIPGFTTRRAETTVELGSGQSFMIGGLLANNHNNSIDKAPGLGDLPILGTLFRSNKFRRQETELVIIVTPYLVKPVSADQIRLPTDGYKAPTDFERVIEGQSFSGNSGGDRPKPVLAPPVTVAPGVGGVPPAASNPYVPGAPAAAPPPAKKGKGDPAPAPAPAPGFSFNN